MQHTALRRVVRCTVACVPLRVRRRLLPLALQVAHAHNHRDPAVVDLLLQLEIVTTEKVEVQVCTSLARSLARTCMHARTRHRPLSRAGTA